MLLRLPCSVNVGTTKHERKECLIFGLRFKLQPAHLSALHGGGFSLFRCVAMNINFYSFWFDPTGNRTWVYRFTSKCSIQSTTYQLKFFFELEVSISSSASVSSLSYTKTWEPSVCAVTRFVVVLHALLLTLWLNA